MYCKERCLGAPQPKPHRPHSQALQGKELRCHGPPRTATPELLFPGAGETNGSTKPLVFLLSSIQVLDTVTQPLLKLCFHTIIVKGKGFYPAFKRHFPLNWLKYSKINRCKSIYHFSFKTGNLHQTVFLSARGTALLKSKHAIVPLILQPTDFIGLKVQRKNRSAQIL